VHEVDERTEFCIGLHWRIEFVTDDGHSHVLTVTIPRENWDYAVDAPSVYSDSSLGHRECIALAPNELDRFGLTSGKLYFEGTRTVCVWGAELETDAGPTPASQLCEETGVGCLIWLNTLADDVIAGFLSDEDDDSFASG